MVVPLGLAPRHHANRARGLALSYGTEIGWLGWTFTIIYTPDFLEAPKQMSRSYRCVLTFFATSQ
jgi:hypothetical protein